MLIVLPLRLSGKGKLFVCVISVSLGLFGLVGLTLFPIWQIIIVQAVLSFLITFLFNRKSPSLFSDRDRNEKDEKELQPLFSLDELELRAQKATTIDVYQNSRFSMKNEEMLEKTDFQLIDEQPIEDFNSKNTSFSVVESHFENEIKQLDEIELIKDPDIAVELPAMNEREDDAQILMKARMKMFLSMEDDQLMDDDPILKKTIHPHEQENEKEWVEETINQFDDLEEIYLNRSHSKNR